MDFDRYIFFFSFIFFLVINSRVIFSVFIRINSKLMGSLKKIINVVNFLFFERREVVLLYVIVVVFVVGLDFGGLVMKFVFGVFCKVIGVLLMGVVVVVVVVLVVVIDVDVGDDVDLVDEKFVVVFVVEFVILFFVVLVVVVIVLFILVVVVLIFFVVLYKDCVINSVKRGMSKVVI